MTDIPEAAAARRAAFDAEVLPHLDAVYRYALALTRETADAEHLTQDTFLQAYRHAERFAPGTNSRAWLFTIYRHLFLRQRARGSREEPAGDVELENLATVVVLSDLKDQSYADIAQVTGVPVGTVKSRLFRGRRLLEAALVQYARGAGPLPAAGGAA